MMTGRVVCAMAASGATLFAVDASLGTVLLDGTASGTLFRSGNLMAEDYAGGVPLPDNGSTGVHQVMNPHLYAGGISQATLATDGIGSAGRSIGASNWPTDGTSFLMNGDGHNRYLDELTVTSDTLSNGTAVVIQFSYHVAYTIEAESSAGGSGGTDNRGFVYANASSNVESRSYGGGYMDGFFLDSGDHRAVIITDVGANIREGLFSGIQHVDVLINAEVGGIIQFAVTTRASATAAVRALFLSGDFQNQTASSSSSVCLAFGASGTGNLRGVSDIVLTSARTGAPFPVAADANAENAAAGLPAVPTLVPGDCDFDGDVDLLDYSDLADCLSGPGGGIAEGCACFDLDGGGDIDLFDVATFQVYFDAP